MASPRKENKRCHLTTGQTPNDSEKKRNRPGGQIQGHIGSRKSLDYDSVEQNNKVSFLYVSLSTCLYFLCLYIMCLSSNVLVAFAMYQGSVAKESCGYLSCLGENYPWSEDEDRATIQFIAMHKDEQATDNEWPAMRN